jgi:hypothetical protein
MTNYNKIMGFVLIIIFCASTVWAECTKVGTTITCPLQDDCSASNLQTQLTSASAGDTVYCSYVGTVTWSSGITVSGGKTLKAGGVKGASGTDGSWPLTINVTYSGDALIKIVNDNSQSLNRVTGFKFTGTGKPNNIIWAYGRGTGSDGKGAFQIDNNYFDSVSFNSRTTVTNGTTGKLTGLLNKNVFYYPAPLYGNNAYYNSYKGASSTCNGYDSWSRDVGFGTDDFVFWEDNYLFNTTIETSGGGGRVVVRHNEISGDFNNNSRPILDGHGSGTNGYNACGIVANEFYSNTITSQSFFQIVDMRGGKWMVYNNTAESGILQINEYRLSNPLSIDWKACSGSFCCPTTPEQCDIQSPDADDFAACYPLLNQVQDTYVWNNIKSSANLTPAPVGGSGGLVAVYVALDRDYWMPTYGTEANLPATCTDDDDTFYGATDTGKMWECTATNTWTLNYTPYTYPHPLLGGADETAPTVRSATIQTNGTDIVIVFDEFITATDNAAFTVDPSGANVTVDCPAVETATNTMTCVISREIQYNETATYGYTGTNVEDMSANDLATISNTPSVVNNSTVGDVTTRPHMGCVIIGGSIR